MSTSGSKLYPFKAIDGLAIHFITNSLSQSASLVMPAVNHVYAENLLIYRLVKLKNMFSLHYPLVDDKLNDGTHSLVGFGRYIAKVIIDKYSYQCSNNPCLPCGRL